ncbi:amidohydrolase family protein [candidate division KSB1 bacterium]|nr:amidohydrolase family protein [candidate division KSB1 bacterium]
MKFNFLILLVAGLLFQQSSAQEQPHVFRGAKLYTISGEPIENGVLVIQNGKIVSVGLADNIQVPADATEHDVTGKVIMPGLVDTHSHIGGVQGGDRSATLHPDVRAMDAIDVRSDSFKRARAGGVTTANIMPGSGYLMSGQTVYVKLRKGQKIDDLLYCKDPLNDVCGGMKMANGTNSLGEKPRSGTRAKSAAMVREIYVKAQEYQKKLKAANGDPEKMPERDLQMEALMQVLDGKRIVQHHTHRHDDIMTVIRLSQEFGFRVVIQHGSEAWKVADEIAKAGIPCSIIMIDSPGGKLEAVDLRYETGAILEKAGVDVAFHTDDGITDSRLLLRSPALAVRAGMSRAKALESVTLAAARMLDLADRVGSLEKGKDADFIVLSGDPLSVYTHIEETWVEGVKLFDRSNPDDRKYSVGGYEVFRQNVVAHEAEGGME